jgi:tol-pal system protein YbgF
MLKKPLLVSLVLALCLTTSGKTEDMVHEHDQGEDNFVLRFNSLEKLVRQQAGEIETLQHTVKQLQEQQRKFQEDVEFRFQDKKPSPSLGPPTSQKDSKGGLEKPASQTPSSRNDAFDPTAEENAIGAPKPLGSPLSAAPPPPAKSQTASLYEQARDAFREKAYDRAHILFTSLLNEKPPSSHMPDALYYLGEIDYQKKKFREAGERFLKVVTAHGKSGRAPESLWKLGLSLKALGNREQACSVFTKFKTTYPKAAQEKGPSLERALTEAKCG